MANFIGILDGTGDAYGVRILDLEGCYGGGPSPEAAINDALSAAREWITHKQTKGEAIPIPRTMSEVLKVESVDAANHEVVIILPVLIDAGRTVRANLTFDAGLLEAIDNEAALRGLTRSAFIASTARERLGI